MSLAVLLAQRNDVTVLDAGPDHVEQVNRRSRRLLTRTSRLSRRQELSLFATLDVNKAFPGADFVVVAAPTNYDLTQTGSILGSWMVVMQATTLAEDD